VRQVVSPYDTAGAGQLNATANTAYARVILDDGADVEPVKKVAEQAGTGAIDSAKPSAPRPAS
jgi:RND superfamily putative drug exporter